MTLALSGEQRRAIWERDKGRCGICGRPVPFEWMDIDHAVPQSQGGTHDWSNLRPSHISCNRASGLNSKFVPKRYVVKTQTYLRLDPELFEAITEAARKAGQPVVQWMAEAARAKLEKRG